MDSVICFLGGGELLQGCVNDAKTAIAASFSPDPALVPWRVDTLVLAAAEEQPPTPDTLDGFRLPLEDRLFPNRTVRRAVRKAAMDVARQCAARILNGKRVLSTCAAGLNRSGLVSGLTLRFLRVSPDDAVKLVRLARGVSALGNSDFEAIVREARIGPVPQVCKACGHELVQRCGCGARLKGKACSWDPSHALIRRNVLTCRCATNPRRRKVASR